MDTSLTGLGEKDRGPTTSRPTRPRDPVQKAHSRRHLMEKNQYLVDKSYKIDK
jgi:hypothetical protein